MFMPKLLENEDMFSFNETSCDCNRDKMIFWITEAIGPSFTNQIACNGWSIKQFIMVDQSGGVLYTDGQSDNSLHTHLYRQRPSV